MHPSFPLASLGALSHIICKMCPPPHTQTYTESHSYTAHTRIVYTPKSK